MPVRKQKKNMKKLADVLKECHISRPDLPDTTTEQAEKSSAGMTLDNNQNETSQSPNSKVPPVFLHKPIGLEQHVRKILLAGVKFYQPHQGQIYTKINCLTFEDHRGLIQYLKSNKLPYHTYSNPTQRKMRVVIRGLPMDTSLTVLKDALKSIDIPIVRVHKMHTKQTAKEHPLLVLAVVPNNDEGKKLMQVEKLLDHKVKVELPINKTKQCHRCQKWGHSQRYCHGQIRCVKCAGEHVTSRCGRDPSKEPPKCANCGGDHTASYKRCPHCPDSDQYKKIQCGRNKVIVAKAHTKPVVVTLLNCHELYKNIVSLTKFEEVY